MTRPARAGLAGLVVLVLLGLFVFFAPFLFAYQPQGADWVDATRNDLWTGGLLALAALLGLLAVGTAALRELAARAPSAEHTAD